MGNREPLFVSHLLAKITRGVALLRITPCYSFAILDTALDLNARKKDERLATRNFIQEREKEALFPILSQTYTSRWR